MEKGVVITIAVIVLVVIAGFFIFKSFASSSEANANSGAAPITKGVPPGSTNYDIAINDLSFQPATLTIKVNDTVTWTNKEAMEHTVTSDTGEEVSSLSLSNGDSYIHTFENAGTYEYHCELHSSMKGTIIVA